MRPAAVPVPPGPEACWIGPGTRLPSSGTSQWRLNIGPGGNIYTTEIGRCNKSGSLPLPQEGQLVNRTGHGCPAAAFQGTSKLTANNSNSTGSTAVPSHRNLPEQKSQPFRASPHLPHGAAQTHFAARESFPTMDSSACVTAGHC